MKQLGRKDFPVLLRGNCGLPTATGAEIALTFIQAISFVAEGNGRLHCGHAHRGHGGHIERDSHLRAGDRRARCIGELDAEGIAAFMRWDRW